MSEAFSTLESSKQIWAILPDDEEIMHRVLHALKDDKRILTANHITCRGIGSVARAPSRKRLLSKTIRALRLLTLVVDEKQADEVFEFIYETADVDRPMGGIMFMGPLDGATEFLLPEGIEDEE